MKLKPLLQLPSLITMMASYSTSLASQLDPGGGLMLQQKPVEPQDIQDINDIFGPLPLPDEVNWLLYLLVAAGFLLVAAILLYYLLRRTKKVKEVVTPSHIAALAELAQARQLLLSDQSLAYFERVSEILRGYIERRFGIRSTRQTTSEFLSSTAQAEKELASELTAHLPSLELCLKQCDLAKYAHKTSARDQMEKMEESVRSFIEETREEVQN